ncbi:Pro-resilin [Papilio machaon]|uniref:Pro-resilin n=1 Tax=Papilio machaon TaxID=76193 RepID=A0A0N0PD84_PAPMA|nr:Pro-resilin [Papilio machaon]
MAPLGYIKLVVAVLSVIIQISISVKSNARPVYEVINEQSKAEERQIKTSAIANLPYGNPLAGNSQQNAKLHAHNQQAMFNAEKVRQHKAQLQQQQKWLKTPQLVHNYMRAYHESQENHQLALEQEQAEFNDDTTTKEPKKYTKDTDAINLETVKQDRKRKHRSHGSVEYHTAYVPDNEAINEKPQVSNTEFIYPQYYPTQSYQSVQDIEILNSLLNKNPKDQLTEFNALLNIPKININHDKELETPIDLYFHLKGPSKFPLPVHYFTRPTQIPSIQEIHKEFTPIKEEESEVRHKVQQTLEEPRYIEPVTKNIEYINTELTNHIVNADYNPLYQEEYKIKEEAEEEPRYQAFYIPVHNQNADITEELSDRYLHNTNGIQHLTKDGSGVSAYDEKVSINIDVIRSDKRQKRSVLDTSPFLLKNENKSDTIDDQFSKNSTELPRQESLIRIDLNSKRKRENFGTFLTTPNFPIGEAIDYGNNDYEFQVSRRPNPNYGIAEYDQDYYDDSSIDYEFETHNKQPIQRQKHFDTFQTYAPSESYSHIVDLKSSYGNYRPLKRLPDVSTTIGPVYSSNLAFSPYVHQNYGVPYTLSQNKFDLPSLHLPEPLKYASSYEFGYRVRDTHSGNDFGHQEEKKGEETNGQYHVLLPDGRMQNVRYSAGPEGFHADISYDH